MHSNTALPDMEPIDTSGWKELLCTSAQEVFEMMVGVPLERCPDAAPSQPGEFTAVIGLAGPINGVFSIRCDHKTACGLACGMLGICEQEARAEVWDALGEVCNMVVGNFKGKTGKLGETSLISVPTVIHGHDYRMRPLVNGSFVECLMRTADGTILFRLGYKLTAARADTQTGAAELSQKVQNANSYEIGAVCLLGPS